MTSDEVTATEQRTAIAAPVFTLERANRALVLVRRVVAEIVAGHQELVELRAEHDRLRVATATDTQLQLVQQRLAAAAQRLKQLAREMSVIGCVVKDCRTGLVDFPAVREGRRVWLCWRLDEPAVAHWHELDDGVTGRQPVGDGF